MKIEESYISASFSAMIFVFTLVHWALGLFVLICTFAAIVLLYLFGDG